MNDDKKMNYFKYKLLCFHHTEKEDAVHGNYENIFYLSVSNFGLKWKFSRVWSFELVVSFDTEIFLFQFQIFLVLITKNIWWAKEMMSRLNIKLDFLN